MVANFKDVKIWMHYMAKDDFFFSLIIYTQIKEKINWK